MKAGVPNPRDAAVKTNSHEELIRHCQRRTRGIANTVLAIEALLLSCSGNRHPWCAIVGGRDEVHLGGAEAPHTLWS